MRPNDCLGPRNEARAALPAVLMSSRVDACNASTDMEASVETKNPSAVAPHSFARPELRTPKAAAIAGVLCSTLLITMFLLLRSAIPADPREQGQWLSSGLSRVQVVLNLLPFAAAAFLWFIGFLRDRLGQREDRFFSTMFLGSGLLFLGMLFTLAALMGGILIAYSIQPHATTDSAAFHIARAASYEIANIYMTKMAAIFIFATSKVTYHTGIVPRWLAFVGYALAVSLLFGSYYLTWSFLIFPLWMLLISGWIAKSDVQAPPGKM
jgi:hypothetical protein